MNALSLSRLLLDSFPGSGPRLTTRECIGIAVSVAGNVLISLSLNLQKLAHRRLDIQAGNSEEEHRNRSIEEDQEEATVGGPSREEVPAANGEVSETDPLLPLHTLRHEPAEPSSLKGRRKGSGLRVPSLRLLFRSLSADDAHSEMPAQIMVTPPTPLPTPLPDRRESSDGSSGRTKEQNDSKEGDYLRSKLWWLGFILMNVGEGGNFISYGFAPASIVAPLGTFALIANCFFAPLLLHERFRKLDLVGIAVAIIGAVTVVLSSNASDGRLDNDGLIRALTDPVFVGYSIACVVAIVLLAGLSEKSQGGQGGHYDLAWVSVDVGVCAIFGGFTVLSTKAISTLLTTEGLHLFEHWIAYPLLLVLLGTGVGQIRYLNRALMRFDSKLVIPTQFVLFNLSAIVGSAILYGDFRKATFHQMVTFLYGCAATFAGVFVLAWSPGRGPSGGSDEEEQAPEDTALSPVGEALGSVSRRSQRLTIVVPGGVPIQRLRHRQSVIGLMGGISPAQRLLLVHSPSQEHGAWIRDRSVDSVRARKVTTWYASTDEAAPRTERARARSVSPAVDQSESL